MFFVPHGYKVADIQTLVRWELNEKRNIKKLLKKGLIR